MNLELFEKVDLGVADCSRVSSRTKSVYLSEPNKGKGYSKLNITRDLCDELGWDATTRVDLYKFGKMYALKSNPVGCMFCRKTSTESKVLNITSAKYVRFEIYSNTQKTEFDAWVEDGVLFFKQK